MNEPVEDAELNALVALRELTWLQLNPGFPYRFGYGDDALDEGLIPLRARLIDDLYLFITGLGAEVQSSWPAVADLITLRLDRQARRFRDRDWYDIRRQDVAKREASQRALFFGTGNSFAIRLPAYDLIEMVKVRWAREVIQGFLMGERRETLVFSSEYMDDPGLPPDPAALVDVFLGGFERGDQLYQVDTAIPSSVRCLGLVAASRVHEAAKHSCAVDSVAIRSYLTATLKLLLMGTDDPRARQPRAGKIAYASEFLEALKLKGEGRSPLLVPADIQRPAAIEQLKTLGKQIDVDVFDSKPGMTVLEIAAGANAQADRQGQDVMIIDTAGRLHIDAELMDELRELSEAVQPQHSLLVVDAMTGQDAVNVAGEFKAQVGIDGVVLTKMDGDARGGAALSVRQVTGAPILFVGAGEKLDALEVFHPDRVAQRILGMGDVMSLIEKTVTVYDEKKAKTMARKMKRAEFTLDDFREQMQMMKQMGDMKDLLKMIPGVEQAMKKLGTSGPDPDKEMRRVEAIINSMTAQERALPKCLNASRRRRIAGGSGTTVAEVNAFMKRFNDAKKVMKKLSKMSPGGLKNMMRGMGM